jgi:hypothetical protein
VSGVVVGAQACVLVSRGGELGLQPLVLLLEVRHLGGEGRG